MAADDEKLRELIGEIAAKHGIAVGMNDPIMMLHTINTRLAMDMAVSQQAALDGFKSAIEEISNRWALDAKQLADRILSESLRASKQAMSNALSEGAEAAAKAVREEIAVVEEKLSHGVRDSKRIAHLNILAGVLAVASCVALATIFALT